MTVLGIGGASVVATSIWLVVGYHLPSARVVASGEGLSYRLAAAGYLDGDSVDQDRDGEQIRDVAIDREGNLYLVGGTQSYNFPVTEGAYDTTFSRGGDSTGHFGEMDVFVTKLDRAGAILWSTYLGGPNYDRAYAVEVDAAGYLYVAGRAGEGFPTTPGAAQTEFAGDSGDPRNAYGHQDGFVSKLAPDGRTLVWSTYFGDTASGFIRDMDIDADGNVHVAATAMTGRLAAISRDAAQADLKGRSDAVYAKLAADGRKVLYATYFGGNGGGLIDGANPSIRVSRTGEVYLTAFTAADDAPVTAGAFQSRRAGGRDLTLAKYSSEGVLVFCTYLGGSGNEEMETHGLALDGEGNPIVAGGTRSWDFPIAEGAFQPRSGDRLWSRGDGFLAKLSADGSRLLASTYLGGAAGDWVEGIAIAPDGGIVVSGTTSSTDFPITGIIPQAGLRGEAFFLTKLDASLSKVSYSARFDGGGDDRGRAVAVSADGDIAAGGQTTSTDFPVVNGFDRTLNGSKAAAYVDLAPVIE